MTKIRFQNVHEIIQFALVDPMLREVLEVALKVWPADTLDINELHRHPFDKNWKRTSPHCGWTRYIRALDVRIIGLPPMDKVVERLNGHFLYDTKRPEKSVVVIHHPPHMHLQVHDRTARKR